MATNVITPEVTANYTNSVFEAKLPPNAKPGQQPEHSVMLLFTAEALKTKEFAAMQAAVLEAARNKFGAKADSMIKGGQLRLPFRTDMDETKFPPGFAMFMNVRSKEKPGIVSKYAGQDGKPLPITDKAEIYSGVKIRASLGAYAYDTNGNKGVSFGLRNIQKLGDGERLDNHRAAEDEFEPLEKAPAVFDQAAASPLAGLFPGLGAAPAAAATTATAPSSNPLDLLK